MVRFWRAEVGGFSRALQAAERKSCCTPEDIARAEVVIGAMRRLMGKRSLGDKNARDWIDLRARAFTLAVNDYAEARRGVNYLRWHQGDADTFAPSLYKGRIKKRRATKPSPEPEEPKPASPQPVIGPNGPFVPASAAPEVSAQPRIPGMPGGSPFIQ